MSTSDMSEESSEAGAGNGAGNGTYSGRGIVLESSRTLWGKILNRLKEYDICRHKIFSGGRF